MPNVEVKCTVSNCVFHAKGNICGAEKIEINMDEYFKSKENTEFASEFGFGATSEKAQQPSETCCNTFQSKESSGY